MRIIKPYDVEFKGKLSDLGIPAMETFWIESDEGERFEVKVPNHPKILEAFEWMDSNNSLRQLKCVAPSYTTNAAEVEKVQAYNHMLHEQAVKEQWISKSYNYATGKIDLHVPGLTPVPERTFVCTWTFWSRDHAVQFKLACGGAL